MKKFIITGAALVALAVSAVASAHYSVPATASCNGAYHGAFGALGAKGDRHDLGQGDTTDAGSVKLGADGPATGAANSAHVCK
jgi:hypothetical protein